MSKTAAVSVKHYTAEDFIRPVKDAIKGMALFKRDVILSFISAIAEDAADLANKECLNKEFEFIPEFTDAFFAAARSETFNFGHDVFVSTDRTCRITAQYEKSGDREEYHITLVDAVSEKIYAYAGKMEIAGAAERPDAAGKQEEENDISEPARAGAGYADAGTAADLIFAVLYLGCFAIQLVCVADFVNLLAHAANVPTERGMSGVIPRPLLSFGIPAALFVSALFIKRVISCYVETGAQKRKILRMLMPRFGVPIKERPLKAAYTAREPEKECVEQDRRERSMPDPLSQETVRKDSPDATVIGASGNGKSFLYSTGNNYSVDDQGFIHNLPDFREPAGSSDIITDPSAGLLHDMASFRMRHCRVQCGDCAHLKEILCETDGFNNAQRRYKCLACEDSAPRFEPHICRSFYPRSVICRSCRHCNAEPSDDRMFCWTTGGAKNIDVPRTCRFYCTKNGDSFEDDHDIDWAY